MEVERFNNSSSISFVTPHLDDAEIGHEVVEQAVKVGEGIVVTAQARVHLLQHLVWIEKEIGCACLDKR